MLKTHHLIIAGHHTLMYAPEAVGSSRIIVVGILTMGCYCLALSDAVLKSALVGVFTQQTLARVTKHCFLCLWRAGR